MNIINASNGNHLFGKEKLKRMLELAGVKETVNESKNTIYTTSVQFKHAPNGKTYGIFREGHKYFIKETQTTDNLTVESFDYLDGLKGKNNHRFSSYSSALKHLNLMFNEFNDNEMLTEDVDMIRTDRLDEKKYVIKVPVTISGEEVASPEGVEAEEEIGGEADLGDFEEVEDEIPAEGGEEEEFGDEIPAEGGEEEFEEIEDEVPAEGGEEVFGDEIPEEGGEEEFEEVESEEEFGDETIEDTGEEEELDIELEEEDPIKEIQKLAGKLSQKIRSLDGEDPELEKYAINMVVSASHPEMMDMEDKEDIVAKLSKERDEEEVIDVETDEVELEEAEDEDERETDWDTRGTTVTNPDGVEDNEGPGPLLLKWKYVDDEEDREQDDEMDEMVDSEAMDEDMDQMEEKKGEEEIIYGGEQEDKPKIKINKEGEIAIYEGEDKINLGDKKIKHTRVITSDQDAVDKAYKGTKWSKEGSHVEQLYGKHVDVFTKGDGPDVKKAIKAGNKWFDKEDHDLGGKAGAKKYFQDEEEKEVSESISIVSDQQVDEDYEKMMFESMIKRTVNKVLSK